MEKFSSFRRGVENLVELLLLKIILKYNSYRPLSREN
jgi:hypothetical protein